MAPKTIDFRNIGYVPAIKYHGIFDMTSLLKKMRSWIIANWFEFHEASVKHKVPSPEGAEQEFEWWGVRKVNSYVKYFVDVFIKLWNLHDVEVVREGQKKKLQSAKLLIETSGRIQLDWSDRFGGSQFLQNLAEFYNNYVVKKDIDMVWADKLYYDMYRFHQMIKEHLDFETKSNAYEMDQA